MIGVGVLVLDGSIGQRSTDGFVRDLCVFPNDVDYFFGGAGEKVPHFFVLLMLSIEMVACYGFIGVFSKVETVLAQWLDGAFG